MPETASQPGPTRTRPAVTLEAAIAACPDERLADRIADAFGLDQMATAEIRERTRLLLIEMTRMLEDQLSEKALALHLQRVVAGFVGSACRSGQFYQAKVGQARELGSRLHDEHPDEDCGGVAGFAGRAQRAREFAAELTLQAHAVLRAKGRSPPMPIGPASRGGPTRRPRCRGRASANRPPRRNSPPSSA